MMTPVQDWTLRAEQGGTMSALRDRLIGCWKLTDWGTHGDDAEADEICPHVHKVMGLPDFAFTELWKTGETPSNIASPGDPADGPPLLMPPPGGNVVRVLEMQPDHKWTARFPDVPAPTMHRTMSVDYVYILEGEVWAVLDEGERLMKAGDVLIQRGTNHGWANRSNGPCRMLVVLNDAYEA
jgi:mannose-6-phosphate isomerase-like protein (cupin superfamily)